MNPGDGGVGSAEPAASSPRIETPQAAAGMTDGPIMLDVALPYPAILRYRMV